MVRRGILFGILILMAVFSLVLSLSLVSAVTTLNVPVTGTNYTTITFNCTTTEVDINNSENATIYYNASGGDAYTDEELGTIINETNNQIEFNSTISIELLDNLLTYNFSCAVANGSAISYSAGIVNVGIDNTAPAVSTPINPLSNGNYSGTIVLNVSINGSIAGIDTVFFNVTNSTGGQNATYTASRQGSTLYWNASLNTAHFAGATYNITIFASDTAGNLNSSVVIYSLTFNNTAPSVTASVGSVSSSGGTLSVTTNKAVASCNYSGAGSGALSGSGTSWSAALSGLASVTAYTVGITCTDFAGNIGSGSVSFTTSSPDSSGTYAPSFWKKTSLVTDTQFTEGYSKKLEIKHRLRVRINNINHYVGVIALTSTTATINVTSVPQQEVLSVGDEEKFDVIDDGYYDISIKLNSIEGDEANITVKSIYEEVIVSATCTPDWDCTAWSDCVEEMKTRDCSDANNCGTSEGKPEETKSCGVVEGAGKIAIIVIIIIVVIAAAVVFYILYKKKRYFKKGV